MPRPGPGRRRTGRPAPRPRRGPRARRSGPRPRLRVGDVRRLDAAVRRQRRDDASRGRRPARPGALARVRAGGDRRQGRRPCATRANRSRRSGVVRRGDGGRRTGRRRRIVPCHDVGDSRARPRPRTEAARRGSGSARAARVVGCLRLRAVRRGTGRAGEDQRRDAAQHRLHRRRARRAGRLVRPRPQAVPPVGPRRDGRRRGATDRGGRDQSRADPGSGRRCRYGAELAHGPRQQGRERDRDEHDARHDEDRLGAEGSR